MGAISGNRRRFSPSRNIFYGKLTQEYSFDLFQVQLYEYKLPFRESFHWSGKQIKTRNGIVISSYIKERDITAWGEAAPLSGFSPSTRNDVKNKLIHHRSYLEKLIHHSSTLDELSRHLADISLPPSILFAINSLFIMRKAFLENSPFTHLLFSNSNNILQLNGTVGLGSKNEVEEKTVRWWNSGYRTIKYKVGHDFAREITILRSIRNKFPDLNLRIDVNENWNYTEALANLEQLAELDIEYCEQPVAARHWDKLSKLNRKSPIPVAVDESLTDLSTLAKAVETPIASCFIIKPMQFGCLTRLIKQCQLARESGIKVVFSSLLDSGIARLIYGMLASGLSEHDTAHGLATGHLFEEKLLDLSMLEEKGSLKLPHDSTNLAHLMHRVNRAPLRALP